MNEADEECDVIPPSSASVFGHRLSLTDLFCTEPLELPQSPSIIHNIPSVVQQFQNLHFAPGLLDAPARGLFISSTNPFFVDLFSSDDSHHHYQSYLHEQFQWKHALQPKYRVIDYLACSTTVLFQYSFIDGVGNYFVYTQKTNTDHFCNEI